MSIDFRSKKAEHHRQVDEIQASVKNLDSMTKAQIKSFASDIGVTVSSTLTKANMITAAWPCTVHSCRYQVPKFAPWSAEPLTVLLIESETFKRDSN